MKKSRRPPRTSSRTETVETQLFGRAIAARGIRKPQAAAETEADPDRAEAAERPSLAGTVVKRPVAERPAVAELAEISVDEDIDTQTLEPVTHAADRSELTRMVPNSHREPIARKRVRTVDELPALRFAIFEESAHLASAQAAIRAAGHVVAIAAAGRAGAERVVQAIRGGTIDAAFVAVPGGETILDVARKLAPRRPIAIAVIGGDPAEATRKAVAAGADLASTRPHDARLAPILLAVSRLHAARRSAIAARGSEQAARARLDELADYDPRSLLPFARFQRVLEIEIKRAKRYEYPLSVALFSLEVPPPPPPPGIRDILRARAGNALIHTIREIDVATQLDHERFLVLLPFTDLDGSVGLGRRVIAAVAAADPVVSGGRSFLPRVVGAVAGAQPGQPVSQAQLIKDATRALDQARRDGAELAVQPC